MPQAVALEHLGGTTGEREVLEIAEEVVQPILERLSAADVLADAQCSAA